MSAAGEIPALCVRPEWAARIREGIKTIETRTWRTAYRGPLIITAGLKGASPGLPAGVMVCLAELVDVRPMRPDDAAAACVPFAPELFAWRLANVRPVQPTAVKSRQGLFRIGRASVALDEPAVQISVPALQSRSSAAASQVLPSGIPVASNAHTCHCRDGAGAEKAGVMYYDQALRIAAKRFISSETNLREFEQTADSLLGVAMQTAFCAWNSFQPGHPYDLYVAEIPSFIARIGQLVEAPAEAGDPIARSRHHSREFFRAIIQEIMACSDPAIIALDEFAFTGGLEASLTIALHVRSLWSDELDATARERQVRELADFVHNFRHPNFKIVGASIKQEIARAVAVMRPVTAPATDTASSVEPLSAKAQAVLDVIREAKRPIPGPEICTILNERGIAIDTNSLTTNYIPPLKRDHWVKNKRRVGYYIQKPRAV